MPLALRQPGLPPAPERHELEQLNRAYLVDRATAAKRGTYDKMQLVPFGEYVPVPARALLRVAQWSPRSATSAPGIVPTVFELPGAASARSSATRASSRRSRDDSWTAARDFLVNVTNDAWYGQHRRRPISTWRRRRSARSRTACRMVRAANTGISAIVDADGRHPLAGPAVRDAVARGRDPLDRACGRFYTRFGDVFVWACALATAVAIAYGLARRTRA